MIYLATQYTKGNRDYNYHIAIAIQVWLMEEEKITEAIYSPIIYYHNIANTFDMPFNSEHWEQQDIQMLALSNKVFFVLRQGYQESVGMQNEFKLALDFQLTMYKITPTENNFWKLSTLNHNPWSNLE